MESNNLVNTTLGKYRVEAEIGRGGMAAVYRGYDPDLDRYVAVKVLAPHLTWDEMFVERFLREARAAARIKHPHIVTIHDVGQQAGWHYFVMEYLDGHSLTDLIRQRGSFPPQAVLGILRPVASALDFAHHSGLVHRDIKPGNIMVSPRGHVTLTDFGIARAAQETRLTGTGTIVGTPEYMSPEQAKGLSVDARSDQYSLAVVAYELLSGGVPFRADSTLALMYKLVHEPPPPISQTRTDLPSGVQPTLARALSKEPGARFATVTAFVDELDRALAGEKVAAVPTPVVAAAAAAATAAAAGATPVTPAIKSATPPPSAQTPAPGAVPRRTPTPVPAPAPTPTPTKDRSRVVIWGLSVSALAILAATIIGCWFLVFAGDGDSATPTLAATKTTAQAIPPGNDKETATASPSPRATRTRPVTLTPTRTPSRTPTRTPTRTPSRTPTRTPSRTPTATRTPTQNPPTATPLPPTATPLPPTATQPPPTQPPPTQPPPTQPPPPPPTQPPQPPKPPPQNTPAPP